MIYLPPFAIQGTHRLSDQQLNLEVKKYNQILHNLIENPVPVEEIKQHQFLNDWLSPINKEL